MGHVENVPIEMINHNDYAALIRARIKHRIPVNSIQIAKIPGADVIIYHAAALCVRQGNFDDNESTMESATLGVVEIWNKLKELRF